MIQPPQPTVSYSLVLDPSFTCYGWAVIDSNKKVIEYGIIRAKSIKKGTLKDTERLFEIADTLDTIIDNFNISRIISEAPIGSKSSTAAKALNLCKGVIVGVACSNKIPLTFVSARRTKKLITGDSCADKSLIVDFITKKYNINLEGKPKYFREAVCDAIAVFENI